MVPVEASSSASDNSAFGREQRETIESNEAHASFDFFMSVRHLSPRNNFAAQQFCCGDDFWGVGGYNNGVRCRKILRRQFVGWRFTLALRGFLDPLLTSIGELQSLL